MSDLPPAKRVKSNFLDTFEVLVGTEPNQKRFTVYHDLFTQRSSFLRAARSERWSTERSKPVDLTDHDPEVFAKYLHRVFFGKVQETEADSEDRCSVKSQASIPDADTKADLLYEALVKLYLLAGKLGDLRAANVTINNIMEHASRLDKIPGPIATGLVYAMSPESCLLRKMSVDLYVYGPDHLPDGDFPPEFMRALVAEYSEQRRRHKFDTLKKSNSSICDIPLMYEDASYADDNDICEKYHQHDESHPRSECEESEWFSRDP